ncbi:hypothetical protein ACXIUS_19560 [Bosea thiooxidans]
MRWRSETIEMREARLGQWHEWFAWYPVRVGESQVWWELVERRGAWVVLRRHDWWTNVWRWIYRNQEPRPC